MVGRFRTTSIGHLLSLVVASGDGSTQASFKTGSIFEACDDLPQTRDAYSAEEKQSQGCGADSSGVCSPIGVRQLLGDAVPGSGICLGLSNVAFVREASVYSEHNEESRSDDRHHLKRLSNPNISH